MQKKSFKYKAKINPKKKGFHSNDVNDHVYSKSKSVKLRIVSQNSKQISV